jgi:hypothetical protein
MKKTLLLLGMLAWVSVLGVTTARAISITTSNDPNVLSGAIVGGGIVISNPTYTGAAGASGTFTGGAASGIGIDTGIILTSGGATVAEGPNNDDSATVDNNLGGDADLTALSGVNTFDATLLEFDFTTAGGDLFFNYVFASEEYNEYTNSSFNDVFAFFLDGTNIALIPGTATPVAINTVNGGNPLGVGASHPEFFNNNDLSDGGPFFDIQYDGFTTVFTAQSLGLGAGTHHIKLAIADGSDQILDSAVFIQGGSFSDQPPPNQIPEPGTLLLLGTGLLGGVAKLRKRFSK